MILELDKISLKEAFNNDNGRTSSKKIIGLLSSLMCLILMTALVIFYFTHTGDAQMILQFIDKIIMVYGISAGLLGVKSIANAVSSRYTPTEVQPQQGSVTVQIPDSDNDQNIEIKSSSKHRRPKCPNDKPAKKTEETVTITEEEIDA